MIRSLASVITLGLASCNPGTTPTVSIPKLPSVSESARGDITTTKLEIDKTTLSNQKLDEKIKNQLKNVLEQKESITEALTQAEIINEKIISKQIVTEAESLNLLNEIKKVKVRNLFLEDQNLEFSNELNEQKSHIDELKLSFDFVELKYVNKEIEANELRNQAVYLADSLDLKNKENEKLKVDVANSKIESSRNAVYRNWIIGLVGSFIIWVIIKNVIMSINPASRFRI